MNPDWGIGQFLAFQRKQYGIASQSEFAVGIGVSRFQLARIESGQTPLSMLIAWKACRKLNIHPDFLVSRGRNQPGDFAILDNDAVNTADALIKAVPDARFVNFWPALRDHLFRPTGDEPTTEKLQLTTEATSLTNTGVQPVLPKLIERLKKATAQRGKKSELAKWLGVHRQCVTDWLSGKQEPGGEIALRMLYWVEHHEGKK